jgi:hypothetical protein
MLEARHKAVCIVSPLLWQSPLPALSVSVPTIVRGVREKGAPFLAPKVGAQSGNHSTRGDSGLHRR